MFSPQSHISRRLFALLLLVAVLPVILIGLGTGSLSQKALTDSAFIHMETIADDHAGHLLVWLHERLNDLKLLAGLPSVRIACHHHCMIPGCLVTSPMHEQGNQVQHVLELLKRSAGYQAIHILDPEGQVLVSTDPPPQGRFDLGQLAVFQEVRARGIAFGVPFSSVAKKTWQVRLMASVLSEKQELIGYILMLIDLTESLRPIMTERAGLGKSGETYLVQGDGHILTSMTHLETSKWLENTFHSKGIDAALRQQSGKSIYTNYRGHEVVGAYRWLPEFRWAVLAEMDEAEILEPLQWIRTWVPATVLAVSLLCILVAWLGASRVSRPIVAVAEASRKMAAGDLSQHITFKSNDEVGTLAVSFNAMSARISDMIERLRQNEASLRGAYQQQRELQAQLIQSEKMAAIGELVAGVVHEMRNTLSSVKLNLQIIGRTLPLSDRLAEHFQIALQQVALLEKMFQDLLDYSKPLRLELQRCSIRELVETAVKPLQGTLGERGMNVRIELPDDPIQVQADPQRFSQALTNVILNGIEAMAPGGTLRIGAAQTNDDNGRRVSLTISDDGVGIPEKHIEQVFQPFFTTRERGTGLGLSIVKKIVEAHGGTVGIRSTPGKGCQVAFNLESV